MGIKTKRKLITLIYHLTILTIAGAIAYTGKVTNHQSMITGAGYILLSHLLTFRVIPLSRYLAQWLIKSGECFTCGNVIELEAYWVDGCRFRSFKPRHIFSPCPQCGKVPGWIGCPACDTSIPM